MSVFAAFPRDTFQDENGNALATKTVVIRRERDNELATLYTARDGSAQTSTLGETATDANGQIAVFVQGGTYKVIDKATSATLRRYVAVGTGAERDAPDGRTIFEASPVSDVQSEFEAGGTFDVNPANPRHRYIKVHDSGTPLTQNMTVDLQVTNGAWLPGDKVTIVKGDASEYTVKVSGFDIDGLGLATLRYSRDSIECIYQSTDSDTGPGPGGGKFERGQQSRINPDAADIAASTANGLEGETVQEQLNELAAGGAPASITPANLTITGTPSVGSVPAYASPTSFVWAGVINSVANAVVTVDDGATLTAAEHGNEAVSGGSKLSRLIVARNSSDLSATIDVTLELNCSLPIVFRVADDQTGAVTVNAASGNTFNGGSVTSVVMGGAGSTITIMPNRTSGDFAVEGGYVATRTLLGALNGNGKEIYGHVAKITEPTGAYSATIADSGALIITDGNLTIPTTKGFHCLVSFGGDHDLIFDGGTYDTGATAGDVCSVIVTSTTTIIVIPLVAAITEGDFV